MTVQQFINEALVDIVVLAAGETASTEEYATALLAFQALIDSLSAQAAPISVITRSTVTMSGAATYTLASRPIKIKAAAVNTGLGLTDRYTLVPAEVFSDQTTQRVLYHDGNTTIRLRPSPSGGSLELDTYQPLTNVGALGDNMPSFEDPAIQRALRVCLAVELCPKFGREATQTLMAIYQDAKTSLTGRNQAVLGPPAPGATTPAPAGAAQ